MRALPLLAGACVAVVVGFGIAGLSTIMRDEPVIIAPREPLNLIPLQHLRPNPELQQRQLPARTPLHPPRRPMSHKVQIHPPQLAR